MRPTLILLTIVLPACHDACDATGSDRQSAEQQCVSSPGVLPGGIEAGNPPDAIVDPEVLVFDHEAPQTQGVAIANVGTGALRIHGIELHEATSGPEFTEGGVWALSQTICADATTSLYVTHTPGDEDEDEGVILIHTNDPKFVDGVLPVQLVASGE